MKITRMSLFVCTLLLAAGCYNSRQPTYRSYERSAIRSEAADRALADTVRAQFNRYGDLATLARDIDISARNGTVTLSGRVPTDRDRRMIVAVAEDAPGVISLSDRLHVSDPRVRAVIPSEPVPVLPTGRVEERRRYISGDPGDMFSLHVQDLSETDRTLAQRVLDGLRTDAVAASMLPVVNIHVVDGRVILRGSVMNDEQRRTIVSSVQRAAGANNVVDELHIQYPRR